MREYPFLQYLLSRYHFFFLKKKNNDLQCLRSIYLKGQKEYKFHELEGQWQVTGNFILGYPLYFFIGLLFIFTISFAMKF